MGFLPLHFPLKFLFGLGFSRSWLWWKFVSKHTLEFGGLFFFKFLYALSTVIFSIKKVLKLLDETLPFLSFFLLSSFFFFFLERKLSLFWKQKETSENNLCCCYLAILFIYLFTFFLPKLLFEDFAIWKYMLFLCSDIFVQLQFSDFTYMESLSFFLSIFWFLYSFFALIFFSIFKMDFPEFLQICHISESCNLVKFLGSFFSRRSFSLEKFMLEGIAIW